MRKILLLGASGSIGSQSLDLLKADGKSFRLTAFSLGKRVEKVDEILTDFPSVERVCVQLEEDAERLAKKYPDILFYHGDDGLRQICLEADYDMAINALVGFSGLIPSLTVLSQDKILCLANKESLVVGGDLIKKALNGGKGKLYPIDSEHVALAKLINKAGIEHVERMIITASGGSFRDRKREELTDVTPEEALAHPTWKMGAKITIDCATMMNKGFEVIEAMHLFDFPAEKIDVLIHEESNIHSMLLLDDGSYLADISKPDMHGPIEWAIYEGKVDYQLYKAKDYHDFGPFHFRQFDPERYPAVGLCLEAYKKGGNMPAVLNAANEEAVYAFLAKKIPFLDIERLVSFALREAAFVTNPSLRDILRADGFARMFIRRIAG